LLVGLSVINDISMRNIIIFVSCLLLNCAMNFTFGARKEFISNNNKEYFAGQRYFMRKWLNQEV